MSACAIVTDVSGLSRREQQQHTNDSQWDDNDAMA